MKKTYSMTLDEEKVSFVSGKDLRGYENTKIFFWLFDHVLTKKTHPDLRFDVNNIILLIFYQTFFHFLYIQRIHIFNPGIHILF